MPLFNASNLLWSALVFAAFGLSVCLHEFGHAIVAYWGGDRTVKDKGYLTLNPLRYTDSTYSIMLPMVFLLMGGIPLPGAAVYIQTSALRGRKWRSAVSAAGPLATLMVIGILAGAITVLPTPQDPNPLSQNAPLYQGLALLLSLEVAVMGLNLIPMPGLDGYGIIEPWLPMAWQHKLRRFSQYGVWILFAAFWFVPAFNSGFWNIVYAVVLKLGVSLETALWSLSRFQQGARLLFLGFMAVWIAYAQWQKRYGKPDASETKRRWSATELEARLAGIDARLIYQRKASTLLEKAAVLTQLKRYEAALVCLSHSLALRSDDPGAWELKGYTCSYLKDYVGAIAAFNSSLQLGSDSFEIWQNLGRMHFSLRQYDEAIAAYDQAVQRAPTEENRLQVVELNRHTHLCQQQHQQCLDMLDDLLVLSPEDDRVAYTQACCYAQLGQIEKGMDMLTKALSSPNSTLRKTAREDPDLAALRSHSKFSSLCDEAPENAPND